jgi:hypothetical protein
MNPADAVLLEGELESKSFLWHKRRFVLRSNSTFSRYNGADLRHSAAITDTTSVSETGSREFMLTFAEPELHYRIRAGSSNERDRWVAALQGCIARTSAPAPLPVAQSRAAPAAATSSPAAPVAPAPDVNFGTEWLDDDDDDDDDHIDSLLASLAAPKPVAPVVNFATEWLDELGCICPKAVDYASQCPKGHALVPLADGGGSALAQRLMCRICHGFTERQQALLWLVCSVAGCCGGYTVCNTCVSALQQAPAAVAAGEGFSSQVNCAA